MIQTAREEEKKLLLLVFTYQKALQNICSFVFLNSRIFPDKNKCDFNKRIERCSSENVPFYSIQCAQAFQTFRLISTLRFLAARKGKESADVHVGRPVVL